LLTTKSVAKTANGKAYEMLSNLVGLAELERATGDPRYLQALKNAWEDVVAHRLYITGTASQHEHFYGDYELPNDPSNNIGETCVTVTWIQLNAQLLRLTGDPRYADELERSYYNHLSAAQRPDGAAWCYYTALEGKKPYGNQTNCCLSSGPRGMALAPELAYLKFRSDGRDGLAVDLFETSRAALTLGGQPVTIEQRSDFPRQGSATLTVRTPHPATFALRVRSPAWAAPLVVRAGGSDVLGPVGGWAEVPARRWKDGDRVTIAFTLTGRLVRGDHANAGRAALMWGPFVLAYDESRNPGLPVTASASLPADDRPALRSGTDPDTRLAFTAAIRDGAVAKAATFVPFAEAGDTGGRYAIWLRAAER
jgi:DUF1680 family protein